MIIGGMQACSLSDYPGRVATVVFTQGCNFRCPFCHNGSLLSLTPSTPAIDEIDLLLRLQARRTLIDAVVVSGGEPTLHNDLPEFLEKLHALDLAVKLDTNGSQPDMLKAIVRSGLIDFIAMDVKAPFAAYDMLAGVHVPLEVIKDSIKFIAASGLEHMFRTTFIAEQLTLDDVEMIRGILPPGSPHHVQFRRTEYAH
jgi:pyruvate formate lyase activating enzyme